MTCTEARSHSSSYIDGDLSEAAIRRVRGHLHVCADCNSWFAQELALRQSLRELEPIDPPSQLWSRIEAELRRDDLKAAQKSRPVFVAAQVSLWLRGHAFAVAACAAALLLVTVAWLVRERHAGTIATAHMPRSGFTVTEEPRPLRPASAEELLIQVRSELSQLVPDVALAEPRPLPRNPLATPDVVADVRTPEQHGLWQDVDALQHAALTRMFE